MTIHETPTQPSAHPYRSTVEPCTLDGDELRVPYSGQARMRLALSSGLAHGFIVIDPAAQDLIAIQCGDGPQPRLRVMAGEIALTWRVSFGEWLRDALRAGNRDIAIVLHPAVEWTLAIHGGLAHFDLDLSAGTVARIDIHGGCSDVRFELPQPRTAVPVRIAGGACRLVVQRPAETGVALAASGGMAALRLDDQRFDAIGGSARLETRNAAPGAPRYELQISGGAADLAIECGEFSR
ncbi:MAG TPA: hypothetical protein VHW23_13345 [Kofleriaceae bacterium]|jgi:hypothetical protein|nr:hypothetical protein [Kofleriaceae bacterium]